MQGWGVEFRSWLGSLDEPRLRRLLTWHRCLRRRSCAHDRRQHPPPVVTRREAAQARVWITRAAPRQLHAMAFCGLHWAVDALRHDHGFTDEALRTPTDEQLHAMFAALDPTIARCAFHALLAADPETTSAAALVRLRPDSLRAAADREPPARRPSGRGPSARRQETDAPVEPTTQDLGGLAADLRTAGVGLAEALRAAADAVASGRHPDQDPVTPAEELDRWCRLRAHVAARVAAEGGAWPEDAAYDALEEELDRLSRARAERETALAALRGKAARYEELVDTAGDEEEAATLAVLLERVRARIAELEHPGAAGPDAIPGPVTAAAPTAAAPTAVPGGPGPEAPPAAPAPEPEPVAPTTGTTGAGPAVEPVAVPSAAAEPVTVPEPVAVPERPAAPEPVAVAGPPVVREPVPGPPTAPETPRAVAAVPAPRPAPAPTHVRTTATPAVPVVDDEPWPDCVPDADWDPRAPWDSGRRAPVVELVRGGRLAEAYWMTAASAEPPVRARALAFAAAAFSCAAESEATPVQITHDIDPLELGEDREAYLLAVVAALRAGLTARWPHALVSGFTMPSGLSAPWQDLLTELVAAVRDCRTFEPGALPSDGDGQGQLTPEEIGEAAGTLLEDLPRRKIKYQRASRVLQYLCGPSGELGGALRAVSEWAEGTGDATAFRALADALRDTAYVDGLIEEGDSRFRTPKQAKESIHSGALRQLHAAARAVGDLLVKADAVAAGAQARARAAEAGLPGIARALRELKGDAEHTGVGGAALGLLRDWLTGGLPQRAGTWNAALAADGAPTPAPDCLLTLPDLPRTATGEPDLGDPRTARRLAAVLAPSTPEDALTRYLDRGDLHLARALVRLVEEDADSRAQTEPDWCESAARRLREAEDAWRRKVSDRHRQAEVLLAQMRTLNQLAPDQEREFTGRLQEFADGDGSGRYRHATARLHSLEEELAGLVDASTRRLREDLEGLRYNPERPLSETDHDRIARLVDEGDTVTAQEFLSLVRGGDKLPDRPADDGAELAAFLSGLTGRGSPPPGGDGVHAGWWVSRYGSGTPLTPAAELGLESWRALCTKRGRNMEWQQHVPRVLRLLGLEPVGQLHSDRAGDGMRRLRVRAAVAERAGYVAALGSRATSYTVLLIWEEQRADGPLAHLEDADVDANIVLYLHPLGPEGRRGLAEAARSGAQQALVVDPAVLGWMAARAPGTFRALQRVTLPWTAYNPYTPFVAGLVPPEVFYGRDDEMREVMDQNGGLFLYGGRQLGKSALLRRVAELFPSRSETNVAVYLDLLKAEIGQAESPDQIWSLLADDLKRRGVFAPRLSERAGPEVVAKRIRDWLEEDDSRRVLVLADEADAFLTADSRRTFRAGGESTFPNVKRFQQLMEHTHRRFKVVFAGLHQVQRFGHLSNVSTAHGGPDVLVGPLKQHAAVRLVTEPMAALGYVFARPELVWRILAITNYQANLVQIFCSELVRTLHARPHDDPGRPTLVTEEDVQEVAASEIVRRRLAERLRFTINLEDRYRVLALVIALRSLEDGYRGDYTARQLLEWAREAWPQGFEQLAVKQVEIFLTEMVGLGLLIQLEDRSGFAVRSPNVVNMLGTREELELELRETEFGLPYDYNPRAARRLLGRDPRNRLQRYSPLTEGQLHEAAQPGVTVIGTTDLHRPQLMFTAASAFAEARGVEVLQPDPGDDLRQVLKDARRLRKNYVLLLDLRGRGEEELRAPLTQCVDHAGPAADKMDRPAVGRKGSDNRSVLVLADAAAVGAVRLSPPEDELPVRFLRPERWTVDALRAWPECPFVSREERGRLVAATGGWGQWTEVAVESVTQNGATLDSALEYVRTAIAKPANVEAHLRQSGLGARDVDLLETWSGYIEEGQGVPVDDVQAAVGLPARETEAWLTRLDALGLIDENPAGLALDAVTFRAVRARGAGR
ncbi:AAA family ATPase [Streptomyces kanasensis]|uniref:AAA family ATPase n=1 Tax=Streptomyces kanasensis TaxID=936756 RepID=UPI0036FA2C40